MLIKNKMAILVASCISCFLFSNSVNARSYALPENCEYGKVKPYDPPVYDIYRAVEAGYDIANDNGRSNEDVNNWAQLIEAIKGILSSFDYLRAEVPKHVIQNQTFRAKGNLFDMYANVHFNNSEYGYVGTDKSNYEGNSYHNMKFTKTHGAGLVWVNRSGGECSAETVWVQKKPKINSASKRTTTATAGITAKVNYTVDSYSKAAKDSRQKVKITLKSVDDQYHQATYKTVESASLNNEVTISMAAHQGRGLYYLTVFVDDGTYSTSYDLGMLYSGGGTTPPPCSLCRPD
ncbi:hypothetical protein [uncultured Shewanella sp.]|uniref:hypothetical protein n=1 Tax=uncultured Shewanella sp. TaxID=173975 RepID=UPI00263223B7|nr:hypothetical protein [uncultured Shewanella sp.]